MLAAVTLAVLALSSVDGLNTNTLAVPVRKVAKQPVLEVIDKASNSRVHLIGVSHGAPASAALVKSTIARVKRNAIVLELCDDRYLSISLDAKVKPLYSGNTTLPGIYDKKLLRLEELEKENKDIYWKANINFMRSQGLLVGTFIGMGLLVTGIQKMFRGNAVESSQSIGQIKEDEFVTAMRAAASESIPVRMGDGEILWKFSIISSAYFSPPSPVSGRYGLLS